MRCCGEHFIGYCNAIWNVEWLICFYSILWTLLYIMMQVEYCLSIAVNNTSNTMKVFPRQNVDAVRHAWVPRAGDHTGQGTQQGRWLVGARSVSSFCEGHFCTLKIQSVSVSLSSPQKSSIWYPNQLFSTDIIEYYLGILYIYSIHSSERFDAG